MSTKNDALRIAQAKKDLAEVLQLAYWAIESLSDGDATKAAHVARDIADRASNVALSLRAVEGRR